MLWVTTEEPKKPLWFALARVARGRPATTGLSRGLGERHRRGQAQEFSQERDGGVRRLRSW